MVMAMMTFCTEARVSAISAIASRIGGIDISPSITRMMTASSQRTKPEIRPMNVPMTEASSATEKPTISDTREPVDHPRIDVAAQHVGAEPIVARRRARALGRRQRGRIHRARDTGAKIAMQHHDQPAARRRRDGRMAPDEAARRRPRCLDRRQHVRQVGGCDDRPSAARCVVAAETQLNSGSSGQTAV